MQEKIWPRPNREGILEGRNSDKPVLDLLNHLQVALDSRYTIQHEIGHGGMAVVYLAEDRRHERTVALKVLQPRFSEVLGADRFLREIKVAARMHHPHLLPLYDSGEAGGLLYYVTPYVEGGSLRQRLTQEGRLRPAEALRLGREIADALDYAHRNDVIHRDIKPENILLDAGHAIVADFGVARAVSAAADSGLTQTGMLLGTPAYMSPEQAGGESLDARSDVYSLGCVLYEMLVGQPPFPGVSPIALLVARCTSAAPTIRSSGVSVPAAVEHLVGRALAQYREHRFQSAAELAQALGAAEQELAYGIPTPGATQPVSRVAALAVLPFVNMSADPENEFFSDGITEELINALSRVKGLRVTSSTSAFAYKGRDLDVRDIGQKLNVSAVLEGSVRRAGNRLRVMAQLINAADGYHLWSESYDRQMADVFEVQDELSRAITASLKLRLTPETEPPSQPPTENIDAYTSYLKGLHHLNRRTVEGYRAAIEFFQSALAKDPEYALPHAGIAHSYAMLGFDWYGGMAPLEAWPLARRSVTRALELNRDLVEAHTALGMIRVLYEWDWSGAESSFRRAIEINPGHAPAHHWFSLFLSTRNRHEESLREIQRAHELDPLSIIINQNMGRALQYAGRYGEAVEQFRRTLALEPRFFTTNVMLAQCLTALGRHEEALATLRMAQDLAGHRPIVLTELTFVLAHLGQTEEARRMLSTLIELSRREHVPLYQLAVAHYAVGDEATAFDLMDKAYEQHSSILPWMGSDIAWRVARNHPRMTRILEKLNVPSNSPEP